jgi:Baseplate J-like protein
MAEIVQVNGSPVVDYMARDYESLLQAMYKLVPSKLPAWTDFNNEADFGNVLLELFAQIGDILSYYQDRVANESFLGTARTRRSVIEHLRLIGYRLATAVPAAASLRVSVPGAVNAVVTVAQGDAFATKSQKTKPSMRFEYTREAPLTIDFSTIAVDPVTGKKTFSGLPVEEGRLIKSEVLGTSDGSPNQRFPLAHTGLILRPIAAAQQTSRDIVLLTQLGATIVAWNLQETLAFSRAAQNDYTVEIDENDEATVIFGDGNFGAIPPNGAQIQATYRVGGGSGGNTPANTIQTIVGAPQLALLGAQVTNSDPSTGGDDREDIQHAVQHAPAVFRSLKRAVTGADYEALAMSFKGVGKVQARATGWNTVTLYIAPEGGGKVSDVLEANLKAYFEDKRMLSQVIEIADVDYVPIYVTAEIGVESYYIRSEVQTNVQQAAAALLAFDNVSFGQTIYLSNFYQASETIPGVLYVNVTEFRRGDIATPAVQPSGKIALAANEVPIVPTDAAYAGGIQVVITSQGGL